jgi:hypothetical protein
VEIALAAVFITDRGRQTYWLIYSIPGSGAGGVSAAPIGISAAQ